MTEDPHVPHEATEHAVRRLLADARHTTPVPADVAVRLDGVLADLRAHPADDATGDLAAARQTVRTTLVVPIGSRRPWSPTRLLTTGLAAAAAVVAAMVAVPTLIGGLGGSSDSASTTTASGGADEGLERDQRESAPESMAGSAAMPVPTVSPERFKRDARRARPLAAAAYEVGSPVCGTLPAGDVVPVLFEDRDGYLVFGETVSARQQVALYLCPDGELVRRAEIPAR